MKHGMRGSRKAPLAFVVGSAALFGAWGALEVVWSYALFHDWRVSAALGCASFAGWLWVVRPLKRADSCRTHRLACRGSAT